MAGRPGPAAGGGRPSVTARDPGVEKASDGLLEPVTIGDPERVSVRWTSKSAAKPAAELREMGHDLVDRTVLRMLGAMGFSMQGNRKTQEGPEHPDRDAQFTYINETVAAALDAQQPVVAVDTKKNELVGEFQQRRAGVDAQGGADRGKHERLPQSRARKSDPVRRLRHR